MAILDKVTVGEVLLITVDTDPTVSGVTAPIGSLSMVDNSTLGLLWVKTGSADTAWTGFPRLVAGQTALQNSAIAYTDPSGFLTTDTTKMIWEPVNSRLGIGAAAPAVPQSTIHIDRGTGIGGHVRFTAGTTTGQTAGDGLEIGIDNAGNAELIQYENSNINFKTNNTQVGAFAPAGQFLLGNLTAPIDITGLGALVQFQIVGTAAVQMAGIQYSADTIAPVFNLLKSRGASIGAQGLLSASDELGRIQFRGSDGTNFQAGASIRALVDATAATGSMPGRLIFMTTPTGSTTPVQRVLIDSLGTMTLSQEIVLGPAAATANGAVQLAANGEIQVRQAGVWTVAGITPTVLTSGTGALTTTSGTYATITGLTATPAAGTYLVFYSVQAGITANGNGDVAIHLAAAEQVSTTRNVGVTGSVSTNTVATALSAFTVLTVNGSQVVDVRFRRNTAGTLTVTSKIFALIPISR